MGRESHGAAWEEAELLFLFTGMCTFLDTRFRQKPVVLGSYVLENSSEVKDTLVKSDF